MKIAAYQFKVSKNIEDNYLSIKTAAVKASNENARILLTQECALTGYPPIEIESLKNIDFKQVEYYTNQLLNLSNELNIYIALGTIKKVDNGFFNSIIMINPNGESKSYDKRALWGYDQNNFIPGNNNKGIWEIDGLKLGIRICFEIRFPEYFRELYKEKVDIIFISFCDISDSENPNRLNIIKSHLISRTIENTTTIISVNGITKYQTAPTCVLRPGGNIVLEAPYNKETIIYYDYSKPKSNFGRDGIIHYNNTLLEEKSNTH